MPELKPGSRLQSTVCATEAMVVKAPGGDIAIECGGAPMAEAGTAEVAGAPDDGAAEGTLLGKRYVNGDESLELVHDFPAWRCPSGQDDLVRLLAAYGEVVGQPSPPLVKLHGNDGGALVACRQAADPGLARAGEGHAVVFGQVGSNPHGPNEFHRGTSIRPYLDILDHWVDSYLPFS